MLASDFFDRAKNQILDEPIRRPSTVAAREHAVAALGMNSASYWPKPEDNTPGRLFSRAETESLKVPPHARSRTHTCTHTQSVTHSRRSLTDSISLLLNRIFESGFHPAVSLGEIERITQVAMEKTAVELERVIKQRNSAIAEAAAAREQTEITRLGVYLKRSAVEGSVCYSGCTVCCRGLSVR